MKITNNFGETVYYMLTASADGSAVQGSIAENSTTDLNKLSKDMYYQLYFSNSTPVTYSNSLYTQPNLNWNARVTLSLVNPATNEE